MLVSCMVVLFHQHSTLGSRSAWVGRFLGQSKQQSASRLAAFKSLLVAMLNLKLVEMPAHSAQPVTDMKSVLGPNGCVSSSLTCCCSVH
jgi:hypothetical protein